MPEQNSNLPGAEGKKTSQVFTCVNYSERSNTELPSSLITFQEMNSKAIKALTEMEEILLPILREHDAVGLKDDDSLDVLDGVHFMELVST